MDAERLARKLAPLMPEEINRLLRSRDLADAELRELIDKQIVSKAQSLLGDHRRKLLLSLPPEAIAKGEIHLGTVLYEKAKWPAGISRGELLQGLAIFGRSGSGKTNVAFHVIEQLDAKGIPWLFLDWKQTGRHLLPRLRNRAQVFTPGRSLSPLPFNPFVVPPGMDAPAYINLLIDIMAEAFTLGDGARSILQKALTECGRDGQQVPTVSQVIAAVERSPANSRERQWKISALRALQSLQFANLTEDASAQAERTERLLQSSTIIELDALSQGSKAFLVPLLCLWLYRVQLISPQRERLSLVVLVEEAHHVLRSSEHRSTESVMEMLLRQCREIGIGMIVVDQHPHLIASAALGNTYTSLCLNQKDPKDINKAAALCLLDEQDKNHLSMLPIGHAIVKRQDTWPQPYLIQVPLIHVSKGAVTDGILRRYLAEMDSGSATIRGMWQSIRQVRQNPIEDDVLNERELAFLADVLAQPDDGVKVRYKRLGVGGSTGHSLKESLLRRGWLEGQVIPIGRSRKLALRLTKQACDMFGATKASPPPASIIHEYWKQYYARNLEKHGFKVELEATRHGGRCDVLASKDGKRIAIEIETGHSNVADNIRGCLRSRIDRVLVVVPDAKAQERVERQLASAGLLIPMRVLICVQGDADGHFENDGAPS